MVALGGEQTVRFRMGATDELTLPPEVAISAIDPSRSAKHENTFSYILRGLRLVQNYLYANSGAVNAARG